MRVLLVCERSGGHVFPALAMAEKLKTDNEVYFFATAPFLKDYLRERGFKVFGRIFSSRNLFLEVVWRFFEAAHLLLKLRPKRVIGFGGRDSFFLILFSSLLFMDTAVYEPNLTFGRANKVLSFFVGKVFCGFDRPGNSKKSVIVGVPLRQNIAKIPFDQAKQALGFDQRPVVFCFGGSQGAAFINKIAVKLAQRREDDYQIIHLTGKREYLEISEIYNKIKIKAVVKDFSDSMEVFYSAADLVVCRAGALTLGEVSYYGLPVILIPHPEGGGHQKKNALYFKERGAAFVFEEKDFCFDSFSSNVDRILTDSSQRRELIENIKRIKLGVSFEEFCQQDIC